MQNPIDQKTLTLLGLALFTAQKNEFALYGIIDSLKHLPEISNNKSFNRINQHPPGSFLSKDPNILEDYNHTLGQIVSVYGDSIPLPKDFLKDYKDKRNFIVHNYFKCFFTKFNHSEIPSSEYLNILLAFISESEKVKEVILGFVFTLFERAGSNHPDLKKYTLNNSEKDYQKIYFEVMGEYPQKD